jgi:hypothetical protein
MTNAKQIEGTSEFVIEPGLARTLRDDSARLRQFALRGHSPSARGGPLAPAEIEEEAMLDARVTKTARAIGCPANYGPREVQKDQGRLHHFYCKRISPPCGGGALSEAEDAEEAQLTARVAAFEESPEGRARDRIFVLGLRSFSSSGLSDAEAEELESLREIYPDLPPDPNDPLKDAFEAYAPGSAESSPSSKETRKS